MRVNADSVSQLAKQVAGFRDERDWLQFHAPKDLAISISVEAAELLELFQWKPTVPAEQLTINELLAIGREIADVAIYLLSLCDVLGLELGTLIVSKLSENERKYPVERAAGARFPPDPCLGLRTRKEGRMSDITPEAAYRPIILRCMRNAGGIMELPELVRCVERAMAGKLTQTDHRPIKSSGEPRWRNNLRWTLKHMKQEGLLQNPTKGHYILTEKGQRYDAT